jgi:hypothetical protein
MKAHTTNTIMIVGLIAVIALVVFFSFTHTSPSSSPSQGMPHPSIASLILNSNKSTYNLGELVGFSLVALNQAGESVCDPGFELFLQPGDIIVPLDVSPECGQPGSFTTHLARYQALKAGSFTAGINNVIISFDVLDPTTNSPSTQPVSIARFTPSQAATGSRHAMVITVTALENVTGTITDTLPEGFEFAWHGPATINPSASRPSISWNVQLLKGEAIDLKYEFITGNATETNLLGPLTLNQNAIPHSSWQLLVADKR